MSATFTSDVHKFCQFGEKLIKIGTFRILSKSLNIKWIWCFCNDGTSFVFMICEIRKLTGDQK